MTGQETSPRYMKVSELAHDMGYSRTQAYKLLDRYGGPIRTVQPVPGGDLRIVRASYDSFCARLERESAA